MQRERNWSTNEVEEQVNPLWGLSVDILILYIGVICQSLAYRCQNIRLTVKPINLRHYNYRIMLSRRTIIMWNNSRKTTGD